ncbi:ATP-binding cassette domain-containing protein [Thiocapsa roseopersicina]|uniref:Osmoprotectant transport system ATP-binding protein n=1 Tax=Thiocapsa roseopersicina TaxID=1058 RepID=A0A1H2VKD9_THIRO|nr:ATP-binding cassette domain-containing protein [Thiocapsa roseopersicina]SDW68821.1 osmoprotectant transport system ATP-binding protein [Thiocapsa roseopersicina]
MLRFEGIFKDYGGTPALADVDLHVPEAQTTVLIGPSGCGKSTLLRLAAGLIRPDRGQVWFEGAPLDTGNLRPARLRMGYMIQDGGLFPHLSVRDNVTLMARQLDWPRERREQRLAELADLVQLPPAMLGRYPIELSGGQRQRVALMRALMLDPDLLLLDEPLGALDPMIRFELQRELKAIFARLGKTVLMVTHDLAEAVFFGHRIVLLRAGRIVQQAEPRVILDNPAEPFVAQFVAAQREPQRVLLGAGR